MPLQLPNGTGHQALVMMQTEQDWCFKALLQAQQEDRQALLHLITPASAPESVGFPHITLTKMELHNGISGALQVNRGGVVVTGEAVSGPPVTIPDW